MNKQQSVAIKNPCTFAEQCSDSKYMASKKLGPYLLKALLTLNIGRE